MKKLVLIFAAFGYMVGGSAVGQNVPKEFLDINNINAAVSADGLLFGDGANAMFEVPKGSGKNTIFASGLWIGGMGTGGVLKLAAQTYRQNGVDFFPGPIDTTGLYDPSYDSVWNRVWKISKCDIDTYSDWVAGGGQGTNPIAGTPAMEVINHWPANYLTNVSIGTFVDVNNDNQYDPSVGDVPYIRGDQAILFCINDSRAAHGESGGAPLGLLIVGMAYSYDCPYDTVLSNTIFVHYRMINYTAETFDSVLVGNWTDFDIGSYNDDYIACDVTRGAYYGYNGSVIDGSGQNAAYGATPPAQAVVFLAGPYKDPNSVDDTVGLYPGAIGCGDGVVDNERLGMSHFLYYNNNSNPVNGNPFESTSYYNYLSSRWKDNTVMKYGADGVNGSQTCAFMFPGDSDPNGFGVGGDTYNPTPMANWDELTVNDIPGDRKGVGSFGSFTMAPGAVNELDFAYVFGRANAGDNLASVATLKRYIDTVRQKFYAAQYNIIPACSNCNNLSNHVQEYGAKAGFKLYPNPANDQLGIEYTVSGRKVLIEFYNATGQLVKKINDPQSLQSIPVADLPDGLYLLQLHDGEKTITEKFLKR